MTNWKDDRLTPSERVKAIRDAADCGTMPAVRLQRAWDEYANVLELIANGSPEEKAGWVFQFLVAQISEKYEAARANVFGPDAPKF